jgi:hypothetical protein
MVGLGPCVQGSSLLWGIKLGWPWALCARFITTLGHKVRLAWAWADSLGTDNWLMPCPADDKVHFGLLLWLFCGPCWHKIEFGATGIAGVLVHHCSNMTRLFRVWAQFAGAACAYCAFHFDTNH